MNRTFFKPSKRKVLVWVIISLFVLFYVPMIKCKADVDVAKVTCTEMNLCKTDYYSSIAMIFLGSAGICNSGNANAAMLAAIAFMLLAGVYFLACTIDFWYEKYRNI